MGLFDKFKNKIKENVEYRRELQTAAKNMAIDRKESIKKDLKMRIENPELHKYAKEAKRNVDLDREIEVRKREATLAELNARKARANATIRTSNQPRTSPRTVRGGHMSNGPGFNSGFDFMGNIGGGPAPSGNKKKQKNRPFDPFKDM